MNKENIVPNQLKKENREIRTIRDLFSLLQESEPQLANLVTQKLFVMPDDALSERIKMVFQGVVRSPKFRQNLLIYLRLKNYAAFNALGEQDLLNI